MAEIMDLTMSDSDDGGLPVDLTADTPPKEQPKDAPAVSAKDSPMDMSTNSPKEAEDGVDSIHDSPEDSPIEALKKTENEGDKQRVRTGKKWTVPECDLFIQFYNEQIEEENQDPSKSLHWHELDKKASAHLLTKGYQRTPAACGVQWGNIQKSQGLVEGKSTKTKPTSRHRKSTRSSEIKDEDDSDAAGSAAKRVRTMPWSDTEQNTMRDLMVTYTMRPVSERLNHRGLWLLMMHQMEEKGFQRSLRSVAFYWMRTGRQKFSLDETKFVTDHLESSTGTASAIPKVEKPNELSGRKKSAKKSVQKGEQPIVKKPFTPEQYQELYNEYNKNSTPSQETIERLAKKFNDPTARVKGWFANRRSDERLGKIRRPTVQDAEQTPPSNAPKLKRPRERKSGPRSPVKKDIYEVDTDDDDAPLCKKSRVESNQAKSSAPALPIAERPKPQPYRYNEETGKLIRKAPPRDPNSFLHGVTRPNADSAREYSSPYTPQAVESPLSPLNPTPSLPPKLPKLPKAPEQAKDLTPKVPATSKPIGPATAVSQNMAQQAASNNDHPAGKPSTSAGVAMPAVPFTPANEGLSQMVPGFIGSASSANAVTLKRTANTMIADSNKNIEKLKEDEDRQLATLRIIENDLDRSGKKLGGIKTQQEEEEAKILAALREKHKQQLAEAINYDTDLKSVKQKEEEKLTRIQNSIQREVEGKSYLERVRDHPY